MGLHHVYVGNVLGTDAEKLARTDKKILKAGHPGPACTMCGLDAVHCLLDAAKGLGIDRASVLRCTHSGMAGGGTDKVVGYGAMVFTGSARKKVSQTFEPMTVELGTEARKELFAAAREAVRTIVQGKPVSFRPARSEELNVKAGCFVTLKNKGRLRGCIGTFTSDDPLWKTVPEMAMAAARRDPRFRADPITAEEVPELDIEISVLSPMRRVTDPLRELQLGRDGILIRSRGRSGTFLPQVAVQTGWTLEEFLGHCSRDKAGLGWEGWKSPDARVYGYTATVLHESRDKTETTKRSAHP